MRAESGPEEREEKKYSRTIRERNRIKERRERSQFEAQRCFLFARRSLLFSTRTVPHFLPSSFSHLSKGTPNDYSGEWVSVNNFETELQRESNAHANISAAFECTSWDYKSKCFDELPINWFYGRAINGWKEGFKLGIDLGIYQQGKEAALQRLAAARTSEWFDRQTRRVTVQVVTLNPNIDVIVSLELGFFFDLGGHARISRASHTFRTNNMYQASGRSISRISIEVLYFILAVRWSIHSAAMILIALSTSKARRVQLSLQVHLPPLSRLFLFSITLYFSAFRSQLHLRSPWRRQSVRGGDRTEDWDGLPPHEKVRVYVVH